MVGEAEHARMRPHIDAAAGREIHRAEIVEKDKGADAAPRHLRQDAGDGETAAQVMALALDRDHGAEVKGPGRGFPPARFPCR